MTNQDLRWHDCRANNQPSWWEHDARGIPLQRVCDLCREAKLAVFRGEVLTNPRYEHDEPISEDHWEY